MYEIIANKEEYQIDHLINGTGNANIEISAEDRNKWSNEINNFCDKVTGFTQKAQDLAKIFAGDEKISTSPASLKTLKIQLFLINDSLNNALEIASKLESDIIKK